MIKFPRVPSTTQFSTGFSYGIAEERDYKACGLAAVWPFSCYATGNACHVRRHFRTSLVVMFPPVFMLYLIALTETLLVTGFLVNWHLKLFWSDLKGSLKKGKLLTRSPMVCAVLPYRCTDQRVTQQLSHRQRNALPKGRSRCFSSVENLLRTLQVH